MENIFRFCFRILNAIKSWDLFRLILLCLFKQLGWSLSSSFIFRKFLLHSHAFERSEFALFRLNIFSCSRRKLCSRVFLSILVSGWYVRAFSLEGNDVESHGAVCLQRKLKLPRQQKALFLRFIEFRILLKWWDEQKTFTANLQHNNVEKTLQVGLLSCLMMREGTVTSKRTSFQRIKG